MNELQIKLEKLESFLIDDGYNDSNIVYQTLVSAQELAINYSQCCKSDIEQLKCGECDCKIKYPNIGCDTIKDCKLEIN